MSDYTKTTNFLSKDGLVSGNPLKTITGAEHDTEYTAIAVASATKLDAASGAMTGTVTGVNITLSGTLTAATIDGGEY